MYIYNCFLNPKTYAGFLVQFFPVIVGDMDNSGSLNAQIIHQVTDRVRSKLAFQVKFPPLDPFV